MDSLCPVYVYIYVCVCVREREITYLVKVQDKRSNRKLTVLFPLFQHFHLYFFPSTDYATIDDGLKHYSPVENTQLVYSASYFGDH